MLNVPITLRTVRERVPKGIRLSVPESKTYHVGRARGPPFPNQDTNPGLLQCQLFDLVRELSQVFHHCSRSVLLGLARSCSSIFCPRFSASFAKFDGGIFSLRGGTSSRASRLHRIICPHVSKRSRA